MKKLTIYFVTMSIVFLGCQNEGVTNPQSDDFQSSNRFDQNLITRFNVNFDAGTKAMGSRNAGNDDPVLNLMTQINASLAGQGIMLGEIDILGAEGELGRTVLFSNKGNRQLGTDWVPNDPRNIGGTDIPYWVDGTQLGTSSGMTEQATFDAMVESMEIWDAITCSDGLGIPLIGAIGIDVGFVQYLVGYGGLNGGIQGTILHAGILPPDFFNIIGGPGGGNGILGVTFTFVYGNPVDGPTDIDGNGKFDSAISEIYINDNFNYQDEPDDVPNNGIADLETVILHEVGHGLSQGHFGTAFVDPAGGLHFSPYALMNAGYTLGNRAVEKTDLAGHCSNWETWPIE